MPTSKHAANSACTVASLHHLVNVGHVGLFQQLLVTALLLIYENVTTACVMKCHAQWGVRCQIIPKVGIDY